jgi:hypothetical protein
LICYALPNKTAGKHNKGGELISIRMFPFDAIGASKRVLTFIERKEK